MVKTVIKKCDDFKLLKVEEGIKGEGCPICWLVRKAELSFINHILHEGVSDPILRREIKENMGFCPIMLGCL